MKKTLVILTVLTTLIVRSQNFEGKILYKNIFVSKLPNVTTEKFTKLIGSEQEYYIKDGKYLSITNGLLTPVQLYKNSTNRIYTKTGSSDTVFCIDASLEKNNIIESKIEETKEVILGYKCKMLTIKTSNNTNYIYYFSEKLKINPESFKNHNYSHWYSYLTISKAIPLKTILENKQFKMVSEAVKVESQKLQDSKFEMPIDAVINCK